MWLIGMMGSGKTMAGRRAAQRLGVGFADTDELIVAGAGRSVSLIWESEGEGTFRRLEREVVDDLASFDGIVATGGGVVLDAANRTVIDEGTVVWLRASVPTLEQRLGASSHRPLLIGGASVADSLQGLLGQREELYRELADHQVDTDDMNVEETVERVVALWSR